MDKITVKTILGENLEEDFLSFDLSEIQEVLQTLKNEAPIDLAHAERLTQKALRGQDILSEFLGKITQMVDHLEGKLSRTKNRSSLEFKNPDNPSKTTDVQRKFASDTSLEVEQIQDKLARAKGTQALLRSKFDTISKTHYHYKEIANGFKRLTPWP